MRNKNRIRSRRRAGALAYTLVMTVCLGLCVASVLSLTRQEHKLTMRRIFLREASNALESTLNYGVSQIVYRTGDTSSIAPDFLKMKPLQAPLLKKVPAGGTKKFSIFNEYGSGGFADVNPSDVEILGGYALVGAAPVKISTGNPAGVTDPDKGKTVFVKTVPLLASVRVPVPGGNDITVYAKASLSIREIPLAAYAVFYNNMTLDIGPGATMNINGAVHSNKDVILGGNGATLSISGVLTSAGNISLAGKHGATGNGGMGSVYVAYKDSNNNGGFDATKTWTYDVRRKDDDQDPFFDANYNKKNKGELIKVTDVVLRDTDHNPINTYADSTLDKRIPKLDPGYGGWKDFATALSKGNMQDSSQGVTPVTPAGMNMNEGRTVIEPPITNPSDSAYDASKEAVKYGNKAGLYLYVQTDGTVIAFKDAKSAGAYKKNGNVDAHKADIIDLPEGIVKSGKDAGSFIDRRENKAVTTVDLDMGKMREYIAGKSSSGAPAFKNGDIYALDTPDIKGWNGIVYVEVQNPNSGWSTFDPKDSEGNSLTVPTPSTLTAVRIVNAATDPANELAGVPDRSFGNPGSARGFTLATNAPLYTKGSVNADGQKNPDDKPSSTTPDSGSVSALGSECAMSLVADAVTTLSNNFNEAQSYQNDFETTPGFTEISAALTVGQTYDATTNSASGGYNNFPRLLEQWTPGDVSKRATLAIRGSMAALFKSRYAVGLCNLTYYRPPARDWGYSAIFGSGYYPPGTPVIRSYRRTNFRYLTAAEYQAEKESFWTKDGATVAKGGDFAKFPW